MIKMLQDNWEKEYSEDILVVAEKQQSEKTC